MLLDTDKLNENQKEADVSREGLTGEKLVHLARVLFSKKAINALETHEKFADIYFNDLHIFGKDGMILDVDECIAPHHGEILPENLEIIERLVGEGWKIVVFSNMKKSDRYTQLEELGVEVITSQYAKPDTRGFDECVKAMEEFFEEKNTGKKFDRKRFTPRDFDCDFKECDLFENFSGEDRLKIIKKQIVMVGDDYLTDGGAIGAGIDFIKVKPIETGDKVRSFSRQVQVAVRKIVDWTVSVRTGEKNLFNWEKDNKDGVIQSFADEE